MLSCRSDYALDSELWIFIKYVAISLNNDAGLSRLQRHTDELKWHLFSWKSINCLFTGGSSFIDKNRVVPNIMEKKRKVAARTKAKFFSSSVWVRGPYCSFGWDLDSNCVLIYHVSGSGMRPMFFIHGFSHRGRDFPTSNGGEKELLLHEPL